MLKPAAPAQTELEMVTLEELVPKDHLLRLIDRHIQFDFIRTETESLYCANNGRPAIDPVVLFKMLFIGYLFGVRSERRLVKEIEVNVAYRWFLGLRLTDTVPDASTLSQNRRRRFAGTGIEQRIFDAIVEQAIAHKLIGGRVLYTDSTHLKANANKRHFEVHQVEQTPAAYLAELDAAVDAAREDAGQKPLRRDTDDDGNGSAAADTKEIKRSTVDPDAGFMVRDQKPVGFFYLDLRTVDGVHALIVDTHVTPGNVNDSQPYLSRLDRVRQRFVSDPAHCAQCSLRSQCTQSRNQQKLITRHLWQLYKEQVDANRLTDLGKRLYARRKETVERSFADAKELHGHRYARFRGLAKVQAQCLLSAACQNMKKIALLLARKARDEAARFLRLWLRQCGFRAQRARSAWVSASFRKSTASIPI